MLRRRTSAIGFNEWPSINRGEIATLLIKVKQQNSQFIPDETTSAIDEVAARPTRRCLLIGTFILDTTYSSDTWNVRTIPLAVVVLPATKASIYTKPRTHSVVSRCLLGLFRRRTSAYLVTFVPFSNHTFHSCLVLSRLSSIVSHSLNSRLAKNVTKGDRHDHPTKSSKDCRARGFDDEAPPSPRSDYLANWMAGWLDS